ncbi:MAG: hypothetical protein PHV06_04480 [bacterium]|nr:hypothetical protein [bacterium]
MKKSVKNLPESIKSRLMNKNDIKHAPEKLSEIAHEIETFLIKPLNAINKNLKFNKVWKHPGPWKNKK